MKKYIIGGIIILVGIIYFMGLYTYFIRTEIQEALPMSSTLSTSPQVIRAGTFGEVDFIHKGSGTARLVNVEGKTILRLEDFNVVSGPDLYVYLSKSEQPTGDLSSLGDFKDLGRLKGTMGNQNYEIMNDATGYTTAVIWCKRYGVLFTYAIMK